MGLVEKQRIKESIHHVRATFDASTINLEERTIDVVFATETPTLVYSPYFQSLILEVLRCDNASGDLTRLNNGAPVCDTHVTGSVKTVLGVVVRAWFDNGIGRATVRFSKVPSVEEVWQNVVDGIITGVSVGYLPVTYLIEEREGMQDLYTLTKWEAREISLALVQADKNSHVGRSADGEAQQEVIIYKNLNENDMSKNASATQTDNVATQTNTGATDNVGASANDTAATAAEGQDGQQRAAANATPQNVQVTANAQNAPTEESVRTAERNRITTIQTAIRAAELPENFGQQLIDNNTPIDQARAAILDEMAKKQVTIMGAQSGSVRLNGPDENQKRSTGIEVALALRSGHVTEKTFTEEQKTYARQFRNSSLLELARDSYIRTGARADEAYSLDKMTLVGRAFTQSGSDFPVLLEGTIRRVLLGAYNIVPDTWTKFCKTGSLPDFREMKRLRLGSFTDLAVVPEGGEFKQMPIDDASYETAQLGTKGRLVNLTRQAIINDDLGGFTDIAAKMGRAARRSIENDVYKLLASNPLMQDGKTLFHADHGNIAATAAKVGVDVLDAMNVQMAQHKDLSGNDFLDITPDLLLIGKGGESYAKMVINAQYDVTNSVKSQVPNRVQGIVSNIIGTPRITGTEWYLFANPDVAPIIEVDFLNGVQTPFLESRLGWSVDGTEWKIRLDYGVSAIDYVGVVKNAGA